MSCRIERVVIGEDFGVFRVSGRIQGEHVDTLRELVRREKGRVALDLEEVLLVDRDAVTWIMRRISVPNVGPARLVPPMID
jgi:hypothetical protein